MTEWLPENRCDVSRGFGLHSLQLPDLDACRSSPVIVIEILGLLGAFLLYL